MTQAYNLSQLANRVDVNGRIDISTATTGTLPISQVPVVTPAKGGTGLTSLPANGVLIGQGINNVTSVQPGAINNVLSSNGTTWVSAPPTFPAFVASLAGTPSQIVVSSSTGNIVLSAPQGIGITSNPQFNSLGIGSAAPGTLGTITATGNIVAYFSDDRLKLRGKNIESALAKVNLLNGFEYVPNETAVDLGYSAEKSVGVSAQEVQAVLPHAIAPAPIDPQYLTVQHDKLIPLLIEAIKELSNEVQTLKAANDARNQ